MTGDVTGGLLGAAGGLGLALVVLRLRSLRRTDLRHRVLPYLRDVRRAPARPAATGPGAVGTLLASLASWLETALGGATTVRRRLERAGLAGSVADFRVEQVVWGLLGFAAAAAYGLLDSTRDATAGNVVQLLVLCVLGFAAGVVLRDQRLTAQVRRRERAVLLEFPTVAELLALAVAAGEGPVVALGRVVARTSGALSEDLGVVLAAVRTGTPVGEAFDALAARTGVPLVARFAEGIAVAVERGTPLTDILHAQAADVREAGRRELIESAARREVLMMVPVVFLVLPVTVVFAFWPGAVGLTLMTP
ncbi:type II secretion system F family protein [Nocardioides jiangxiensis]|uniref:Type II secretion system F family protein n=1 Tax=Nocardioides jiangxiensis TaxID=3064524 RepID=A0ABT9B282_9ACTN|nr:type II secretion system F family protein [Nocardioides sp. WY-20]MDO7868961.1 type II secretion system F family protein [Nocardioides sp. WY-20]